MYTASVIFLLFYESQRTWGICQDSFSGLATLHHLSADLILSPSLSLGKGGEAGRLGAGGSGHGAVSSRSGAGPPPRPVAVSAAESSQSAADLNYTCPAILPAALTQQHSIISLAARFPLQGQTSQTKRLESVAVRLQPAGN